MCPKRPLRANLTTLASQTTNATEIVKCDGHDSSKAAKQAFFVRGIITDIKLKKDGPKQWANILFSDTRETSIA